MTTATVRRAPGQWRSLGRATHPRQALAIAVVVGALIALMGRPLREIAVGAAAVLVVQLILGLVNDLTDERVDRLADDGRKPIADGTLERSNATFVVALLLLVAIPLCLQNGFVAGAILLGTIVVGVVHNRVLHGTALSWVGWSATFAMLAFFVTLGGWGRQADGAAPRTSFVVLSAVLGLLVHFMTSLPDLVKDNDAGVRHLPLRIALRTGAPRLFAVCTLLTLIVTGLLVYDALSVGIAS